MLLIFFQACLAYCFITIPSIESEFERLYLYVNTGQVALLCQSLPQADEMFKSAINLIKEVLFFYYSLMKCLISFIHLRCLKL